MIADIGAIIGAAGAFMLIGILYYAVASDEKERKNELEIKH